VEGKGGSKKGGRGVGPPKHKNLTPPMSMTVDNHSITAVIPQQATPITAILPQASPANPRYYRKFFLHYRCSQVNFSEF
jgi:hypothetical protein